MTVITIIISFVVTNRSPEVRSQRQRNLVRLMCVCDCVCVCVCVCV